jgi:hypothetical protein
MNKALPALLAGAAAAGAASCSEPCCVLDSQPIALRAGGRGELLARFAAAGETPPGEAWDAVIDTGTPVSLWEGGSTSQVELRSVRLLGAVDGGGALPTRAVLERVVTVGSTLGAVGSPDSQVRPRLVLGGDMLVAFSLEIGFARPEVVFWTRQPVPDDFLSATGHAVLRVDRKGGGELEARGLPDWLGLRGPHQYPSSSIVLRACVAPDAFSREATPPHCCRGDERTFTTGTDMALVLGTGTGPLVLARAAWERLRQRMPGLADPAPGSLLVAGSRAPIAAGFAKLPRLALVDRQASSSTDPGPCVELGRARRLEQIAFRQAMNADAATCVEPCDQDLQTSDLGSVAGQREYPALDAAGYIELAGAIDVAVIDDSEPLLQTLRQEIRPEGPEIAGIVGAGALRDARLEMDYRSAPARAIFSCEAQVPAERCRAVGRCPRLPEHGQTHRCFGLPAHALPRMCDNYPTSCP